jgi:D-alanyl-D-alanine carboxypeptidase (penicillin-binding protein 5/6)
MNRTNRLLAGVLFLLLTGRPGVHAAQSAAKSSSTSGTAKSAGRKSLARDPYLGAIIMDASTGKVLFEDGADARGIPASLLKLMDLLVILDKIQQGQLSLHDQVQVSAKATKAAPSKVWLAEKESFTVDEMLYALMVESANDAAIALAEKVAGSTDAFLELMNQKAKDLGMTNSAFHSVNGLPPARGQEHDFTSARDMAILCREVLKHAETLRYSSTRDRTFRPNAGNKTVAMHTHNHLLGRVPGCDGLKTGYISDSGFSIAVTAARNGHRIIVIVLDSTSSNVRDQHATELVAKGFAALGVAPVTPVRAGAQSKK